MKSNVMVSAFVIDGRIDLQPPDMIVFSAGRLSSGLYMLRYQEPDLISSVDISIIELSETAASSNRSSQLTNLTACLSNCGLEVFICAPRLEALTFKHMGILQTTQLALIIKELQSRLTAEALESSSRSSGLQKLWRAHFQHPSLVHKHRIVLSVSDRLFTSCCCCSASRNVSGSSDRVRLW